MNRRLAVLSVAYPLAPVSRDSVGGAEQILSLLDHALVAAGHESIVIAMSGSRTAGRLIALPAFSGPLVPGAHAAAVGNVRTALNTALEQHRIDVIHLHGVDFPSYLPAGPVPVIATLHLPLSCYPEDLLRSARARTVYCCVSQSQAETCSHSTVPLRCIPNGIRLPDFPLQPVKSDYALLLARICPEKGVHLAIQAARRAGTPLVIAGQVYEYPEHRRYFEQEVAPMLDDARRHIGPAAVAQKRDLLARARCLLVPSLIDETSSLVTMEALACGTPVIAFRRGALPELIRDGETGFLVDDVPQMSAAIRQTGAIHPSRCREYAIANFSAETCFAGYESLYSELSGGVAARHARAEVGELADVGGRAGVMGPDSA